MRGIPNFSFEKTRAKSHHSQSHPSESLISEDEEGWKGQVYFLHVRLQTAHFNKYLRRA
jgi:hypothetical protein